MLLKDKTIIVTGAASGIGRATALAAGRHGACVVLADLDAVKGAEALAELRAAGGEGRFVTTDISSDAAVAALVGEAVSVFGRVDGAFNNAGIEMAFKSLHELTLDEWRLRLDINLTGPFLCMKHEIAAMLADGKGGAIVNTASVLGIVGGRGTSDYTATKHGVVGLTQAAAADYGELGIRINAILPGTIETPMITERALANPGFRAGVDANRERHVMKRFGRPEEIGEAVCWLLSDAASFVTGASMPVDGGYLAN